MLVLSRKRNEEIKIGEDVTVRVLSISGNYVKLGFDAPIQTRILRTELAPKPACSREFAAQPGNLRTRVTEAINRRMKRA